MAFPKDRTEWMFLESTWGMDGQMDFLIIGLSLLMCMIMIVMVDQVRAVQCSADLVNWGRMMGVESQVRLGRVVV